VLTITENAADVVNKIVDQSETEAEAGIRISQAEDDSLALATAVTAEPGDQVIEEKGARVFLDKDAAIVLNDKTLDATVGDDGSVQFAVGVQA
jgi:Fe-S cluster assembly iron-binding protein IscA